MSMHLLFNMTHDQINLLKVIVESGSFARASTILNLEQSSISKSIKRLEDRFGIVLLKRHGKGVAATPEGKMLLDQAILLSNQSKVAIEKIQQLKQQSINRISSDRDDAALAVSVANECADLLFGATFAQMSRRPDLKSRLAVESGKRIEQQAANGAIDIGVLCDTGSMPGLVSRAVAEVAMVLVFGPVLTAASEAIVPRVRALGGLPMLLPSWEHSSRQLLEQHALRAGVRLDIHAEIADLSALKTLLRQGLGYSVLPFCAVRDEVSRGLLCMKPLTGRGSRVTLSLICRATARHDPRVAAALSELSECLGRIAGENTAGATRLVPRAASTRPVAPARFGARRTYEKGAVEITAPHSQPINA